MTSIFVPPHVRVKLATENLVKAVLGAVHQAGEAGLPVAQLRAGFQRLEVPPDLAQRVENRLVREGILKLEAGQLRIGSRVEINAYLARSGWGESRVVAVAPEEKPA